MGGNWEEPSKDGSDDESGDEGGSEEEEEKESVREGLDSREYDGAVCDSSEGLVGISRGSEPSRGSIWRAVVLMGAPEGRSGEVSFNLDIALPKLVAGDESEELGRSKESE